MKLDMALMKNILLTIEDSDVPVTNCEKIATDLGLDIYGGDPVAANKFGYHLIMLHDEGAITPISEAIGIDVDNRGESLMFFPAPLRMTASGHDFLDALRDELVWNKLQSLGNVGLGVAMQIGTSLLQSVVMGRLGHSS